MVKGLKANYLFTVVIVLMVSTSIFFTSKVITANEDTNSQNIFYVAPNGNDKNPGTKEQPFATLLKARDAARKVTSSAYKKIIVRGGKYYKVSVILEPIDSGLIIKAEQDEKPVLYGGRSVTNWVKDGEKFYSAAVPGVKEGIWDFRALVVNDGWRSRARYPDTGSLSHCNEFKVPWMSTTGGGWRRKPTFDELTTMQYKKGDLGLWLELKNAELTIFHQWDESLVGIRSLEEATQTIRFSTPAGHPPGAFYHSPKARTYLIWNIREGMNHPGQWYLDRAAGKVVYWPKPGEDMSRIEVIAPTTETIFKLKSGVRNITIEGISISATTTPLVSGGFGATRFDAAISGKDISNCTFWKVTVANVGGWGIKAEGNSVRIEDCEVTGTGAGGILFEGENIIITNSHIHDVGVTYPSAIAVSGGGNGRPCEISHNEIHGTPYSAITCSGDNHRIHYNLIYDTMRELFDGGGIYITFCKGITLFGNIIRGSNEGYKRHAYYLDEQAENCVVENNLAFNSISPSHNHMAKNNIIRNNVFYDKGESNLAFYRCKDFIFENNIVYAKDGIHFIGRDANKLMPNNIFYSAANKLEEEKLSGGYQGKGADPLDIRDGSVVADPIFIDAEHGNFNFKPDSPALKLGIKPIDVSRAGRTK